MKRKSSLLHGLYLPIFSMFVVVVFLLTISVNVKAASGSSFSLPYYVDNSEFSFGGYSVQDIQNFCNNKYGTSYTFDLINNPTLFYTATGGNGVYYLVLWNSNSDNFKYYFSNYSVPLEHFDTTTDHVSLTFTNVTRVQLYIDNQGNLHDYSWWPNQASSSLTFFGSYYYPVYISQNFNNNVLQANVYFESDTIIISKDRINASPFPVGQGHATEPEFENNVVPGTHVLPHQVPTLTINNYTWTTAPAPDLSTLEKTLESIYYYLTWLGSNLTGSLNNLVSNIVGLGDYLGLTIQYYCGLIINNIQDFNSNFYDNMVSLFEPIAESLNKVGVIAATIVALGTDPDTNLFSIPYLTKIMLVPDTTNIIDLMVQHDEFSVIPFVQVVSIKGQYLINQLVNVTPSHTFHVPSCYFHGVQIGDFDLDFGWYDNYKIYFDTILNGFLILGYILWLFVTFKDHMRGTFITGNDEPHVIGSNNHIKGD